VRGAAVQDEGADACGIHLADEGGGVRHIRQDAGDVGEEEQLLGLQLAGDAASHVVGVDVQRLAVRANNNGRDDRDVSLARQA
jgi:hypothetical protein